MYLLGLLGHVGAEDYVTLVSPFSGGIIDVFVNVKVQAWWLSVALFQLLLCLSY
jgi:hypothetical protein